MISKRFPSVFLLFALLPCVVLALAACGSEGEGPQGEGPQGESPTPAVEVVQARYGALPLQEQLSGTVRATGQVQVVPEGAGQLVSVMAQNGDLVQKGQPLARINAQLSQAQLSQAQASLQSAQAQAQEAQANLKELRSQFKRTQALAEKGMVSQQTLESQRAQVQSAEAAYQQAQAQVQQAQGTIDERTEAVGQTVVRAPISGRVGQRNAEVGMQASAQTPLFTIGDLSKLRVEVPVTQEMIGRIREGQPARITAGGLQDSTITAEVSRISPFLEAGTYSAEAEIDVDNENGRLRPGMYVDVEVSYGESQQATLVPTSALYENPNTGVRGVYVAPSLGEELQVQPSSTSEDGRASMVGPVPMQFREIEVVAEGGQVAGIRGVEPDTWVVVVGQHLLESGGAAGGGNAGSGPEERGPSEARARPVSWNRIVDLQNLQQQDLLRRFMEEQQQSMGRPSSASADSAGGVSAWQDDSTARQAL